jgi:hypothetical protein
MEAYQQRVIDERRLLEEKIKNLRVFIASKTFDSLDKQDRELLGTQASIMISYSAILAKRIARWQ